MTINLNVNGVIYPFPEPDDENWGQNVTDWAQAVTGGMLQKAGGNFSLTADANFGASFGLVSTYFKSRQSNISTVGALRLAHADVVGWRNQANSADLQLGVNASDLLTFNGNTIQNTLSVTDTATIDLTLAADTLSADVVAGSLTNTQISASAAIARTKLASGSANHVLINDGSGVMSSEAALAITRGGTGAATKGAAFDALAPTTTKGDLIVFNGTTNVRQPVGPDGQVLTADSGQASGYTFTAPLTNPMDAAGQMIYGGAAGAPNKTAVGSANQMLQSNGASAPTWNFILNANIDAAAAIAYSKLALTGSIVNADINASAAIAYTKLALSNSILNADINSAAAIAYSKLSLSDSIVNSDINASAAIAYSKLSLTGSIVNADINASAAIAYSKLAALTASRALVSSAGGVITASATTDTQIGYLSGTTGTTGAGNLVLSASPTFTGNPTLAASTGTSLILGSGSLVTNNIFRVGQSVNAAIPGAVFENSNTGSSAQFQLQVKSDTATATVGAISSAGGNSVYYGSNSTSQLDFIIGGVSKVRLASNSRTWIYTHNENATTSFGVVNTDTTNSSSRADMRVTSGSTIGFMTAITANSVIFGSASADNVGIQTSGGTKLQIFDATGIVRIQNLAGTGSRAVNASAAGDLSAASDSRLKKEVIGEYIPGLEEILRLRPVAYRWLEDIKNRGKNAAVEIGFFADEAALVIPSAAPIGTDGYYGFFDRSVIAAMTRAFSQLHDRIVKLEEEA